MATFKDLWRKLSSGKDYRKEYVSSLLKRGTAMQIQALMKQKGWTQSQLAEHAGLTQGVISRASNPAYGNLTFNTVIELAAGFDVAFVGRFMPFSEFVKWVKNMPDEMAFAMPSFDKENANASEVLRKLEEGEALREQSEEKRPGLAEMIATIASDEQQKQETEQKLPPSGAVAQASSVKKAA